MDSITIGIIAEDKVQKAVARGFIERWCKGANIYDSYQISGSKIYPRQSYRSNSSASSISSIVEICFLNHSCDYVVILKDADETGHNVALQQLRPGVSNRIDYVLLAIPDRNIECWLALDRHGVAELCRCSEESIPSTNPAAFIKGRLKSREDAESGWNIQNEISNYTKLVSLRSWLADASFKRFYSDVRAAASRRGCLIPDEYDSSLSV